MGFVFKRVQWSPVEFEYLKENYKKTSINQLCIMLSKSNSAIKNKIKEIETGIPVETKKCKQSIYQNRIGKRKDCDNIAFRSAYEANIFRYLRFYSKKLKIAKVEYEPEVFIFHELLKKGGGTTIYIPDFRITYTNNTYNWLECKGYLKPQDKTKINRFLKYYPEEASKLVALTPSNKSKTTDYFKCKNIPILWYYNELNKTEKDIVPNWEKYT